MEDIVYLWFCRNELRGPSGAISITSIMLSALHNPETTKEINNKHA